MQDKEKLDKALQEAQTAFQKFEEDFTKESESAWNALDKDQQLLLFCAVVRRIWQAVHDNRSYRGTLYDVFEFGTEAYVPAQLAGYLDLHNGYYTADQEYRMKQFERKSTIIKLANLGFIPENMMDTACAQVEVEFQKEL